MPAEMLDKSVETLKNINTQTAKYAKWYVRVLDPKVIDYTFTARNEKVEAQKFSCVLVSNAPAQYMLGAVPFSFKNRTAAVEAFRKFTADSVWELRTPSFDTRAKSDFIGGPLKSVVLLCNPSTLTRVPPTSTEALAHPAKGLQIALDIKGIVELLKGNGTGANNRAAFDFCGKFLGITTPKQVNKNGSLLMVAEAEFTDAGGGKIVVAVWKTAREYFAHVRPGSGVAVLGCSAALENGEVKINIWPGAHISTVGDQVQSLTSLDATGLSAEVLTAQWVPSSGSGLASAMEAAAHSTCAVALADAIGHLQPITFQINRCLLDAPLQRDAMYTQDGRLFLRNCRLRDATGGVDVDVVTDAAPTLYDCSTPDQVAAQLDAQSLTGAKHRFNIRGILRQENGVAKRYIMEVAMAPLDAVVSTSALRMCCGLSVVSGDVVLPVPVSRIVEDPLQGLAVCHDGANNIGANRVWLLVRGQSATTMESLDDKKALTDQVFKVSSTETSCLLTDPTGDANGKINLVGYCDFNKMLAYRLDKETALVLASAVECPAPGIASATDGPCRTATIEHVVKLSKDEVLALQKSMAAEWKAILTRPQPGSSPAASPMSTKQVDSSYWSEERQPKLRRIQSEPQSPNA